MGGKVSSPLWEPDPFWNKPEDLRNEISRIQAQSTSISYNRKLRIVICACGNDGKSSTINNILAALSGTYNQTANTGGQDTHVTQKYIEYKMFLDKEENTSYYICDTPGLRDGISVEQQSVQTEAIKAAIMGKFISGDWVNYAELTVNGFEKIKTDQGMADCVIFVIDSKKPIYGNLQTSQAFTSMKSILQFVQVKNIKTACLLTKCDELDNEVKNKLAHLYYSTIVETSRSKVQSMFSGFPGDRIFPIVNYTINLTPTAYMMVQILFPFKHIMSDILSSLRRRV